MNRWGILNNSMATPTDTPVRDERTPPGDGRAGLRRRVDARVRHGPLLRQVPRGPAAGHRAADDDVKSQYPDMAGGQVVAALDALRAVRRPRDARPALPGDEGLRRPQRRPRSPSHIWPDNEGFGDWCPPIHGGAANGGMGGPERRRLLQRGLDRQHRAVLQAGRRRRQGRAGARPHRRRGAFPQIADAIKARLQRPLPQRRGRRLRRRPPDDEHPPAGLRHGPGGEPAGGRRPARPEHPRRQRRPPRHRHLRHALHRRRARGDRPDRCRDDRPRPEELSGLRVRARARARRRRGSSGPTPRAC